MPSILAVFQCNVHAKSLQSCPTLCDPMNCSPPDSSVRGILQARILEWVAISSSKGIFPAQDRTQVSCFGRWILYHKGHLKSSKIHREGEGVGVGIPPSRVIFGSLLQEVNNSSLPLPSHRTDLLSKSTCPGSKTQFPMCAGPEHCPLPSPALTQCPSPQLLLCSACGGHPSPSRATRHIYFQDFVSVCKTRFAASYQNHNATV